MGNVNDQLVVVVDADAIVALASPTDSNHQKATQISERLQAQRARLVYPMTAMIEGVTAIQRVLSSGITAYETAVSLANLANEVETVDQETYNLAVNKFFSPTASKKNTMFDAIVAAVTQKIQADAVFSFDKFYKSRGFKLASDL